MLTRAIRTSVLGLTLLAAPTALAVVGLAAPASADAQLSPVEATQGEPMALVFRITNSKPAAKITKVEIRMPNEPIAEAYPMSVPDWAPSIASRKLDQPITGVHGFETSDVVSSISWITMPGKELAPGASSELKLSIGPMPQADQVTFGVVETYSDGTSASHSPVMRLRPGAQAAGHGQNSQNADPAAAADKSDEGPSNGWWLLSAALILGVVIAFVLIRPRLSPTSAGSKGSKGSTSTAKSTAGSKGRKATTKTPPKTAKPAAAKANLSKLKGSELLQTGGPK